MQTVPLKAAQSDKPKLAGGLNGKQRRTLEVIYINPVRGNILWTDIENLFGALGATVSQGRGSRVRVALNGVKAVFHEPHPEKEICKGAVKSVRKFLEEAGFTPMSE
ncbi:MAG TPA: type II toxin-antitoxin system HicA family toxin [Oscillatoriaceae cyanobacterium M33_DOE_052]|uniref:Type II toxin-antitoxin system HicA family toxin n=1 Tax=Planktothricoides sp. SpSt-374 TaxID=2282167 RepID=A0A7C3ZM14_9CYAN|nr:type II toxin-antitoxin system HicA family toxin [Oscillatoriaceae cyanobacterium M33_DOE_052]